MAQLTGNTGNFMMLAPTINGCASIKMGRTSARYVICTAVKVFKRNVSIRMCRMDHGHEACNDWRSLRARLVKVYSNSAVNTAAEWAHEIANIEDGCVWVATNILKFHPLFSQAVVLLFRWSSSSSDHCKGIVLNKTLPGYCNFYMDLADPMLTDLCVPKFVGGPALGSSGFGSKFHLLTTQKGVAGFECILPGLYVGNKGVCLQSAMRVRGGDVGMRLYLGEVEMEKRHLTLQVEAFGWWKVVACSSFAIFSDISSPTNMWHHINHLLTS